LGEKKKRGKCGEREERQASMGKGGEKKLKKKSPCVKQEMHKVPFKKKGSHKTATNPKNPHTIHPITLSREGDLETSKAKKTQKKGNKKWGPWVGGEQIYKC